MLALGSSTARSWLYSPCVYIKIIVWGVPLTSSPSRADRSLIPLVTFKFNLPAAASGCSCAGLGREQAANGHGGNNLKFKCKRHRRENGFPHSRLLHSQLVGLPLADRFDFAAHATAFPDMRCCEGNLRVTSPCEPPPCLAIT